MWLYDLTTIDDDPLEDYDLNYKFFKVLQDNISTINLIKNHVYYSRIKYIEVNTILYKTM